MLDARKEQYRTIIRRATTSLDGADTAAVEAVYRKLRAANEALLRRKAAELTPTQAHALRAALEDVIGEHRRQLASGGSGKTPAKPMHETPGVTPEVPRPPVSTPPRGGGIAKSLRMFVGALVLGALGVGSYFYVTSPGPFVPVSEIVFNEKPGVAEDAGIAAAAFAPWGWTELPLVFPIDDRQSSLHAIERNGATYTVAGNDPQVIYDIADLNIAGQEAPYLGFHFACAGQGTAKIQVFWWGDAMNGPAAQPSAIFPARSGRMMVPLGASASWTSVNALKGVRLDPENRSDCDVMTIADVGLYGSGK